MRFWDLISVVSAIAGIISLVFTLIDRFASWRKYILPLSYGLRGGAAGRMSTSFAQLVTPTKGTAESLPSGHLILFLVIVAVLCAMAYALIKVNQPLLAYFAFFIGLSTLVPQVMKSYSESGSIPVGDLLIIANEKERVGDLSGAITYVEKAIEATPAIKDLRSQ